MSSSPSTNCLESLFDLLTGLEKILHNICRTVFHGYEHFLNARILVDSELPTSYLPVGDINIHHLLKIYSATFCYQKVRYIIVGFVDGYKSIILEHCSAHFRTELLSIRMCRQCIYYKTVHLLDWRFCWKLTLNFLFWWWENFLPSAPHFLGFSLKWKLSLQWIRQWFA